MELLIVMAIIAILAGLSLFALRGTRESARDGRRLSDLETIRSALEIYRADCDYYPDGLASGAQLEGSADPCNTTCPGCTLNVYLQAGTDDPLSNQDYFYQPLLCTGTTDCRAYRIWTALEDPPAVPSTCPGSETCGAGVACNYCVNNP